MISSGCCMAAGSVIAHVWSKVPCVSFYIRIKLFLKFDILSASKKKKVNWTLAFYKRPDQLDHPFPQAPILVETKYVEFKTIIPLFGCSILVSHDDGISFLIYEFQNVIVFLSNIYQPLSLIVLIVDYLLLAFSLSLLVWCLTGPKFRTSAQWEC